MKVLSTTANRALVATSLFTLGMGFVLTQYARAAETIDILVLYTQGTEDRYNGQPETRVNHLFNVANQSYFDSGLDLKIRPVHLEKVDYPDNSGSVDALYDMTYKRNSAFADVEQLRQEYGADMVMLYRPYSSAHGNCGVAWIGGNKQNGDFSQSWMKSYMYSHVSVSTCGDYVTAHELGHNMGLNHSRLQNGSGGTFDYALGHGEYNKFVTMMAYQSAFNVNYWSGKEYKFSSPELDCRGLPCGVDKNDPVNGADAVSALRVTTPQIADFFPTMTVDDNTDDNHLQELKNIVLTKQAIYDDLVDKYTAAKNNVTDALSAYRAVINEYRQLRTGYMNKLSDYRMARASYISAYRSYIQAYRSRNYSAMRSAYNTLMAKRSDYINKRSAFFGERTVLIAKIGEIRAARAIYRQARQEMYVARNAMINAQKELIAAKRQLTDAGGIV